MEKVIINCTVCNIDISIGKYETKRHKGLCRKCSNKKRGDCVSASTPESHKHIKKTLRNMIARCSGKYDIYKTYDKINVCDEWKNNPELFIEWSLDNGYKRELSIDRKDSTKDYTPDNCRWYSLVDNALDGALSLKGRSHNTSGYTGVWLRSDTGKFSSELKVNGKKISLGSFDNAKDGAIIRDNFIKNNNLRNKLNFPE